MSWRLIALLALLPVSAEARSCSDFRSADTAVRRATTKAAITEALVSTGAPRDAVENLARASPDTDVMRAEALRALSNNIERTCTPAK